MSSEITMIERIPVEFSFGQHEIPGLAAASKDLDSGEVTIVIVLDPKSGLNLEDLMGISKLKTIGFSGVRIQKGPSI
jgi:hypothetical protein